MSMSAKNLVIVVDHFEPAKLKSFDLGDCDYLAMTPWAMLALQEKGRAYLTFDDFYSKEEFCSDNKIFVKELENLFLYLDRKYEGWLNFPRAFTGNIYWFLVTLPEFYYFEKMTPVIKKEYIGIYLMGGKAVSLNPNLEFSTPGLTFPNFRLGFDQKLVLLQSLFKAQRILGASPSFLNKYSLRGLVKMIERRANHFPKNRVEKGENIFVIEDGYEVKFLKQYMPQYNFIDPLKEILPWKNHGDEEMRSAIDLMKDEALRIFLNQWFPQTQKFILALFEAYHREVLSQSKSFQVELDRVYTRCKPVAVFFPAGIHRLHEDMIALLARNKDIPVFSFQHGGTTVFFNHPFTKYSDLNLNVKQIKILHSQTDDLLKNAPLSECHALGSIKLQNLSQGYEKRKNKNKQKSQKVLYCPISFSFNNYKELIFNAEDRKLFEINKDVLELTQNYHLALDVKVHPVAESSNARYFKYLRRELGAKGTRILKQMSFEDIVHHYDLLILDCVSTALLPMALVLDIPVILYLKDTSILRDETLSDLKKRFYLVHDNVHLNHCLSQYASGKLNSKFFKEMVDKYAFPVDQGDIGVSMAEFICRRIKEEPTFENFPAILETTVDLEVKV